MIKLRGNFKTDRHGHLNPNYKDGRKNTRLYRIWANIKTRCYNSNTSVYKYYGARGIVVCEEWKNDFKKFYDWAMNNGYSDELTIDRIDNNGNYEPSNCRWVSIKTQCVNRRSNHIVTIGNETKTLSQWCDFYEINYQTVQDRLRRGWNCEKALKEPIETKFRKRVV